MEDFIRVFDCGIFLSSPFCRTRFLNHIWCGENILQRKRGGKWCHFHQTKIEFSFLPQRHQEIIEFCLKNNLTLLFPNTEIKENTREKFDKLFPHISTILLSDFQSFFQEKQRVLLKTHCLLYYLLFKK